MRPFLSFTLPITLLLSILYALLIGVAQTVYATQAGEIAFQGSRAGNWDIYLLDLQTGITHNLTNSPADDYAPVWSPDGSQIAFVSDRDGDQQSELYVINADGGDLRRVTPGSGVYRDPFWSPDGQSLVIMHGYEQIYRVNVATHSEQWLGIGFTPRLSPDGTALLYYAESASRVNYHIYLLSLTDHHITDLTPGATHNWNGVWSPDGSKILFELHSNGQNRHLPHERRRQRRSTGWSRRKRPQPHVVARRHPDRLRRRSHRSHAALRQRRRRQPPAADHL